MKRILIAALLCVALPGCAGFTAFVQKNAVTIGSVGLVAGAVSSVESAALNTDAIVEKAFDKK